MAGCSTPGSDGSLKLKVTVRYLYTRHGTVQLHVSGHLASMLCSLLPDCRRDSSSACDKLAPENADTNLAAGWTPIASDLSAMALNSLLLPCAHALNVSEEL